ncbi:hypothetical protein [Antribacter gilvus]|uniref:hypothetical protein n=1 Tax=Antribacter gilvus TaxID=2304675 RepID=UPI000F772AC3|nr:hypothetical protein [Antribacter gilvus]
MAYTRNKPPLPETPEQLRARIPGWGVDLDRADRPAVPRERFDPDATGAHWDVPDQQPELRPRERSVEHARLTPVFGTAVPLKGVSGAIRRYSYARFSEGRAAHWLLLILADRVDVVESTLSALVAGRPDNPVAETGIRSELSHHGWSSRVGRGRADVGHLVLDPVVVAAPWVVGGAAVVVAVRAALRRRRA